MNTRRFLTPCLLFSLLAASSHAAEGFLLSITSDGLLPGGPVADEEVLFVSATSPVRRFLSDQTLALHFGDRNGDGHVDTPGDIDALEFVAPGAGAPVVSGVYFSLVQDQGGFHDGDILRFDPSSPAGVEVFVKESELTAALQANDGNIDVDAVAFLDDGSVLFSLAEDETVGPQQVVVFDDDVLIWRPGLLGAGVYKTGLELETIAEAALGKAISIGDVKGLEAEGGELLFTIQSPSSDDATIFSTAGGGQIALAEAAMGFASNVEADALAIVPSEPPASARFASPTATAGNNMSVSFEGLTPSQPFVLLLSTASRLAGGGFAMPGWGVLALDPNEPLFLIGLANAKALAGVAGPDGSGAFFGDVPPTPWPYELYAQAYDVATGGLGAPAVLEVNH